MKTALRSMLCALLLFCSSHVHADENVPTPTPTASVMKKLSMGDIVQKVLAKRRAARPTAVTTLE